MLLVKNIFSNSKNVRSFSFSVKEPFSEKKPQNQKRETIEEVEDNFEPKKDTNPESLSESSQKSKQNESINWTELRNIKKKKISFSETHSEKKDNDFGIKNPNVIPSQHNKASSTLFLGSRRRKQDDAIDSFLMRPQKEETFVMKPMVKCSHCEHISPVDLSQSSDDHRIGYDGTRGNHSFAPELNIRLWERPKNNFKYFGQEKAENVIASDSFVSDIGRRVSGPEKKDPLTEFRSEIDIKRTNEKREAETDLRNRTGHLRANTNAPLPNLSHSSSLAHNLLMQKKNVIHRPNEMDLGLGKAVSRRSELFQLLLSQLRLPEKEFAEELVKINNKFLLQSGRAICVGICSGCEQAYQSHSSRNLSSQLHVPSPAPEKILGITNHQNHIQYSKKGFCILINLEYSEIIFYFGNDLIIFRYLVLILFQSSKKTFFRNF